MIGLEKYIAYHVLQHRSISFSFTMCTFSGNKPKPKQSFQNMKLQIFHEQG